MDIVAYNKQLNPCLQCKTRTAEIFRTENSVGVMCNCGAQFVFEDADRPLKDVVEWWNKHYGLTEEMVRPQGAKIKTKVTLKKVNIASSIKWNFVSGLIGGFFIGIISSVFSYLAYPTISIAAWLFWYVPGSIVLYGIMGIFTGIIMASIYNLLSGSLGGLIFETESEEVFD